MAVKQVSGDGEFVSGSAKSESFLNDGNANVTINALGGNDTIDNGGPKSVILGGDGNDFIDNSYTSENDGFDHFEYIGGYGSTIDGGAGNDTIRNYCSDTSIYGGAGNDYIYNAAWHLTRFGYPSYVTINGGAGDDTISLSRINRGVIIQYGANSGNDVIINFSDDDTLELLDGVEISGGYIGDNGTDVILQVGDGSINIKNGAGKELNIISEGDDEVDPKVYESKDIFNDSEGAIVDGDLLNDRIENTGDEATIRAGAGDDYIVNTGDSASIDAGDGNDYVYNSGNNTKIISTSGDNTIKNEGSRAVISTGDGNDYVYNEGENVSINTGDGDDVIDNRGEKTTINAGKGDDEIYLEANSFIQYASGDGNDVIYGYEEGSTIKFTSGTYNVSRDGNDVIFNVGSGSITVKDATGKSINVINSKGKASVISGGEFDSINNEDGVIFNGNANPNKMSNAGADVTINALGGNDYIVNEGEYASISAGAGNDRIVDKSEGITTINAGTGNDTIELTDVNAEHIIQYVGGNDVISGLTENDLIKIVSDTIDLNDYSLDGNNVIFNTGSGSLTIINGRGVKINIEESDGTSTSEYYGPLNTDNFTANEKVVGTNFDDTINNWAEGATVSAGSGSDVIYNDETGTSAKLLGGAGNDSIRNSGVNVTIDAGTGDDYVFNEGQNVNINGGTGNDYISNKGRRATITGGAGDDYIENAENTNALFVYSKGDGNDVIAGFGAGDSLRLSNVTVVDSGNNEVNDYVITVTSSSGTNTITLKDGGSNNYTLNNGVLTQNTYSQNVIWEVENREEGVNFTVSSTNSDGDKVSYYMFNDAPNVTIRTGTNDDTIEGSDLYGEVFKFAPTDGNDLIVNFAENDSIYAQSGTIQTPETVDGDVIVKITQSGKTATITLEGAADYDFSVSSNKKWLTVAGINSIDNSEDDKKVTGTDGKDYITNYGKNVTVEGLSGNDTIECSDEGNVIKFGATDGRDVVLNFSENDSLKITAGEIESHKEVNGDYVVVVKNERYTGTITLKDAGDYKFRQFGSMLVPEAAVNYINNNKSDIVVNGTAGNDWITSSGENVTIASGAGNDTIEGSNDGDVFEFAYNTGNNVILKFDEHDSLSASNGTISGAISDNDYIVTISGASDKSVVTLQGGASQKYVLSSDKKLLTVDHITPITNASSKVTVTGTSGDDSIVSTGSNVTIRPLGGNDTITGDESKGDVFVFAYGSGNNLITNFDKNDSIKSTSGTLSGSKNDSGDYIVTIASGSKKSTVTLAGAGDLDYTFSSDKKLLTVDAIKYYDNDKDRTSVKGSSGRDIITSTGNNVTIVPGTGNDTITGSDEYGDWFAFGANTGNDVITNFSKNDSIKMISGTLMSYGAVGDDVIVTFKSKTATGTVTLLDAAKNGYNFKKTGTNILTVAGDPTLTNDEPNKTFTGTADAEYMINEAEGVIINGRGGNDTLVGSDYGEVFYFTRGDGDDVILNFGENDTIQTSNATILAITPDGDANIVSYRDTRGNVGTVRLENTAGYNFVHSNTIVTVDVVETLQNNVSGAHFYGTDRRDYLINTEPYVTIHAGASDTVEGADEYGDMIIVNASEGNNVVTNFGIGDTLRVNDGSITGGTVVGDDYIATIKSSAQTSTVTLQGAGAGKHKLTVASNKKYLTDNYRTSKYNTKDNTTFKGTSSAEILYNSGDNVTINPQGGADTIVGSDMSDYREVILLSSTTGNKLIKNFGINDEISIGTGSISAMATLETTLTNDLGESEIRNDLILTIKSQTKTAKATLEGAADLDCILSSDKKSLTVHHVNEMVNTADSKKITGTDGDDYIINSGANVTIAPGAGNDTIEASGLYNERFQFAYNNGDNVIIGFGYGDTLQATSGKVSDISTSGKDVIVTISSGTKKSTVTLLDAADLKLVTTSTSKNVTVGGVTKKTNTKSKVLVAGTSGDDYIINTGQYVTIQAKAGDDTIEGSDYYADTFQFAYGSGNNTITNFRSNDTIRSTSGKISSIETIKGADGELTNDVLITIASGTKKATVTLVDAADLKLKTNTAKTILTATGVNYIDTDENNTKVSGTAKADYITSSGMNVTIEARGGNDTIEGSDFFADVFSFAATDGSNVITNFGLNDTLLCTSGTITGAQAIDNDYVVTMKTAKATGTVTLQGAGAYEFKNNGTYLYVDAVNNILATEDNTVVSGTSGRDYITSVGQNVVIRPLGGNDTITGSDFYGDVFEFAYTYGDNVITNFSLNDTLKATSGTITSYAADGDDFLVEITGKTKTATVRLLGAGSSSFRLQGTNTLLMKKQANTDSDSDSSAQLPVSNDEIWFMDNDYTAVETNELDTMMNETAVDTSIGKLTVESTFDDVAVLDNSARSDLISATTFNRHQSKK